MFTSGLLCLLPCRTGGVGEGAIGLIRPGVGVAALGPDLGVIGFGGRRVRASAGRIDGCRHRIHHEACRPASQWTGANPARDRGARGLALQLAVLPAVRGGGEGAASWLVDVDPRELGRVIRAEVLTGTRDVIQTRSRPRGYGRPAAST